jgi:hypothetical protein
MSIAVRVVGAFALSASLLAGCYLSHRLPEDAGSDSPTRCGAASCSLVAPRDVRIEVLGEGPPLPRRFEATVISAEPLGDDDLRIEILCDVGCPRALRITGVGSDIADPLVLAGPVEVSLRERALVIRGDPCPGCDDGGVAAGLLLAVMASPAQDGDLPMRDVIVSATESCESFAPDGSRSVRFALTFGEGSASAVLEEGQSGGLSDRSARVLRSSYECASPDLLPPDPFEVSSFVVYAIGPR